ncbi:TPA: DNA recombination protein RmuC [Candidatus Falkowbacteria bacterium]|nr:DNA recombination protein RmuC [Candidatus Falkowbacteria bacterium]
METILLIILFFVIAGFGLVIFFVTRKPAAKDDSQSIILLQDQVSKLRETVDAKLSESSRMMQDQFGQSTKIIQGISGQSNRMISEITEKLTKLDDTNKQVIGFAEQLQSLENILKNPKQRGILGEYYLETLLKNIFAPSQYEMQYKFSDGEIVDAVIFLKDQIIPIDSKFSLENYNKIINEKDPVRHEQLEKQFKQDLKNRIDETSKYIRPQEKTTEFAFMFIPSEGIYYDLLVNQVGSVKVNTRDLIEYAFKEKKVIIVSPTSFYAYLQTVIHGLRKMQIEEQTKEIIKNVELLNRHLVVYEDYLKKMGNNLSTTVNMYNSAYKEFEKIDKDVVKITGKTKTVDATPIDKPKLID